MASPETTTAARGVPALSTRGWRDVVTALWRSRAGVNGVVAVSVGGLLAAGVALDLLMVGHGLAVVQPLVQGGDLILLRDVALQWRAGGDFYPAWQLAGPYEYGDGMVLYPPIALALFLPFTVLPAFLWWLIPLAIVAGTIRYWRPRPAALVAIGICAASYPMIVAVNQGNPTMWIAAFLALGTRWPAYAALVLLKPSLFPFALFGIRQRGWWIVAAILAALALVMLPLTIDWLHVMANMRGGHSGLLYSLPDAVVLAIPFIAWLGRSANAWRTETVVLAVVVGAATTWVLVVARSAF